MTKLPITAPAPSTRPRCYQCRKPLTASFRIDYSVEIKATYCRASVSLDGRPGLSARCEQMGALSAEQKSVCPLGHVQDALQHHVPTGKRFHHFGRSSAGYFCTDRCAVAYGESAASSVEAP